MANRQSLDAAWPDRRGQTLQGRSGVLPVAALLAIVACGGEKLPPPADDGSGVLLGPCEESQAIETLMIADFEGDYALNPPVSWFTNSDGTAPPEQLNPVPPAVATTPLEEPRCGAQGQAFHIVASGFQAWGYSFGFNALSPLNPDGPPPDGDYFDAREWDGISMWVRKGSSQSGSSIFASVADRYTDPAGLVLFEDDEPYPLLPGGTYCGYDAIDVDGDGVTDPTRSQCDRFGAGIGIALEWRFFKVPFDRMVQRAYGRSAPTPSLDRRILGFDFGLDGPAWDFWIDDLAFYRERPAEAETSD